jgi:hypothetical protein
MEEPKKNLSREPKQTAFLSIITIINEHGWKGSLFFNWFHKHLFPEVWAFLKEDYYK